MTNQEKEQFFALYWGQEVLTAITNDGNYKTYKIQSSEMHSHFFEHDCFLSLKDLKNISDEDAIEVLKLCNGGHPGNESGEWPSYMIENVKCHAEFKANRDLRTADYLRSKGYALPWKNYSIENLINEGVIKLV